MFVSLKMDALQNVHAYFAVHQSYKKIFIILHIFYLE